jgi:hypothetical protein
MAERAPLPLFDSLRGQQRKREGMDVAANRRTRILALARTVAERHAELYGTVTIDDVMQGLTTCGLEPADLGQAAGSVFRGKAFKWTGAWMESKRPSNHARAVRVWRLVE